LLPAETLVRRFPQAEITINFLCDLLPRVVDCDRAIAYTEKRLNEAQLQAEAEQNAVKEEFANYKKTGETRQVAERRRISSLIAAVKNVDGGLEGLQTRWTPGIACNKPPFSSCTAAPLLGKF